MEQSIHKFNDSDNEDDDVPEETQITWSDLIFLPFHPVFKMIVLMSVIVKCMMGPIKAIYPIIHCSDVMDTNIYFSVTNYFYTYFSDVIYFLDTFLHIIHRQVTETTMKREHLPKSAFLLLIDVISLIPFFALMTYENCALVELWPNILAFTEFIVIYRIVQYFSLISTHSYWKLATGFILTLLLCVNCICCFLILLTLHGFCANCKQKIYDWRKYIDYQVNFTDDQFTTYIYGALYIMTLITNNDEITIKPSTILEYLFVSVSLVCFYIFYAQVIVPKLFSESTLVNKTIFEFYLRSKKIIDETKRRNPSKHAYVHVISFYTLMWDKRKGIINIPNIITELPQSIRVDIKYDLVWPLFYHSPTLRTTSNSLKRYLSEFVHFNHKMPGDKFYTGFHCHTNMYYLKSGIIQLISYDDGVTPLLSLTSGTILGDVNFVIPSNTKHFVVRCMTYCEVLSLSRYDILHSLKKYPVDRRNVIQLVKNKLKHARTLYTCKQHVRGLDRTEDEGIAWIKRRWWEISNAVTSWKKKCDDDAIKCELPQEEAVYHCAKYIGQLVLCSDVQLHTKTLFVNVKFPWILSSESSFLRIWHRIVTLTVFLVLLAYPPNLIRSEISSWFNLFRYWTDFVYIADISISILTTTSVVDNFTTVILTRCKRSKFVLDILATIWLEYIALLLGRADLFTICQVNRLIKIYFLFTNDYANEWNINKDPTFYILYRIILMKFCLIYISYYVGYMILLLFVKILTIYLFLEPIDEEENIFFGISIAYLKFQPHSLIYLCFDIIIDFGHCIMLIVFLCLFISCLCLRERQQENYKTFVTDLKNHYKYHRIHQDLMRRLDKYLLCQWKYYRGMDIMHPISLKEEAFDIYWKVQGEVAESIIGKSNAFIGADPSLVRELASCAKFLIMPKHTTLLLFGIQSKIVSWIVQGHIKCEYHNEDGELLTTVLNPGQMVSVSTVLLKRPSLKTYSCNTDCELIYIKIEDFSNIIKAYPKEASNLQKCIEEFNPLFEKIFQTYVNKHKEYLKKLKERIIQARHQTSNTALDYNRNIGIDSSWRFPDSDFMYYWMIVRTVTVFVAITSASLQGGIGVPIRRHLIFVGALCDCVACIDFLFKMLVTYYNDKGIVIFDKRMCIVNYLKRGFLLDIIGTIPWPLVCRSIMAKEISDDDAMLLNTITRFSHLYILMSFFDYIADSPSINSVYILIAKWQVVTILIMFGCSHFLVHYCVDFSFDDIGAITNIAHRNQCWMPTYYKLDGNLTLDQLHLVFAETLNFVQSKITFSSEQYKECKLKSYLIFVIYYLLQFIFWYIQCYCVALMVLTSHSGTLFQHGVNQLQKFLTSERVDQTLIDRAVAHFSYWWKRTKGINIDNMMRERIGMIFRQDLSYFFYKRTFMALDTMLNAGESIQSQLSSTGFIICFRPGEQIVREMDYLPYLFVVHRGQVVASKEGQQLAILRKGAIFGPLNSREPRPVQISAKTDGFADVLRIPIKQFQEIINDKVRLNIADNRQSKSDYMTVQAEVQENPLNTIEYILRGRKSLHLPWMKEPTAARKRNWYSKFLFIAWFICPSIITTIVLLLGFIPYEIADDITWLLFTLDLIHLAYILSEFYTIGIFVYNNSLVKERHGYRLLKRLGFYTDCLSLIVPYVSIINGYWAYHLVRLLRLRLFYLFHQQFCSGFKSRVKPILMKIMIIFLISHALSCGWIYVACRDSSLPLLITNQLDGYQERIDYAEWEKAGMRKYGGCSRAAFNFKSNNTADQIYFVVPKNWENDYIIALTFIVQLFTQSRLFLIAPINISQIYYKIFIGYLLQLMHIWILSMSISAIRTKYWDLYLYDYNVNNLMTYLHQSGLSPSLLDTVKEYTRQLWQRQAGNWLPELAHQAPTCLREDLFGALYMHHLMIPPMFKTLPEYFNRQLVAKFKRTVLFPGKCIVEEGDINACIFFIHEGEVEKRRSEQGGENRMVDILTINDYFGIVPSFFDTPFIFSYYTRTVVDLAYLKFSTWKDLLAAYPDIKAELMANAEKLRKEQAKGIYRHTAY